MWKAASLFHAALGAGTFHLESLLEAPSQQLEHAGCKGSIDRYEQQLSMTERWVAHTPAIQAGPPRDSVRRQRPSGPFDDRSRRAPVPPPPVPVDLCSQAVALNR